MHIMIPRRPLRAMLHLASTFDARFYLVGVYVEASPTETRLTATDGAVMGTFRDVLPEDVGPNNCGPSWSGIITRETIERLPKPGKYDLPWHMLSDSSGVLRMDDETTVTLHNAAFPKYRELFASMPKAAGEPAQFNPELLTRFAEFARDGLDRKKAIPSLRHHGAGGALVGFAKCPEFAGVVMPVRLDAPTIPAWIADPVGESIPQEKAA